MEKNTDAEYFALLESARRGEFGDGSFVLVNGVAVPLAEAGINLDRKVCSNTLMPFIKEQEAKKRQQMKKRGKRK